MYTIHSNYTVFEWNINFKQSFKYSITESQLLTNWNYSIKKISQKQTGFMQSLGVQCNE